MATAQPGIFALGTRTHLHLEFQVHHPAGVFDAVRRVRDAANLIEGVNLVVGFGPDLWGELSPGQVPVGAGGFEAVVGPDGFTMPAAQFDVWLWLHGASVDAVFDLARFASTALAGCADVAAEQWSFVYRSSRDLTGFEDGTENPPIDEAMVVASIPPGGPCEGGSVALLQRWEHDLDGFARLDTSQQESVIGRTLRGSVELDESIQLPTAHVARVVIDDEHGDELEVFRRSTAFGGVQEHGLMFVAFSADRDRLQRMLERMAGAEDGIRDRLTEFSTPTASAWYVVPPLELLADGS